MQILRAFPYPLAIPPYFRPARHFLRILKIDRDEPATTNEIPFERLRKEGLSPLKREYIMDRINLRRVQKDCLISYAGNQYSVPAEYVGKDVAVVALDSML